jgi:hypothetical protein
MSSFSLHFELLKIKLMLLDLHQMRILSWVLIAVIMHDGSSPFNQIEMLLHFYMDLLGLLFILIHYFCQALVVSLLFFLLYCLRAEGHAYIAIVVNRLLQVTWLSGHFLLLFVNSASKVIFVPLCAYLFFLFESFVRKNLNESLTSWIRLRRLFWNFVKLPSIFTFSVRRVSGSRACYKQNYLRSVFGLTWDSAGLAFFLPVVS